MFVINRKTLKMVHESVNLVIGGAPVQLILRLNGKNMKPLFMFMFLVLLQQHATAQTREQLAQSIAALEDRSAIKNIVDTFSILADVKDIEHQVLLFTENASVESVVQGQPGLILKGRKQIGEAFSNYLHLFETVYHLNGQQTITLKGDQAKGVAYCLVTLIGIENNKRMKTTMGVYYHDEFEKISGRWFISKRTSHFVWQEKVELH